MVKCKERKTSIVKKKKKRTQFKDRSLSYRRSYFLYFTRCEVTGYFTYERCALYGCIRSYNLLNFVEQSNKVGASVKLEQVHPSIENNRSNGKR